MKSRRRFKSWYFCVISFAVFLYLEPSLQCITQTKTSCENCVLLWRGTSLCDLPSWHSTCIAQLGDTTWVSIDEAPVVGSTISLGHPHLGERSRESSLPAAEECLRLVCKQACTAARMPAIWMRAWDAFFFFFHYKWNETFLSFHRGLTSWPKLLFHEVFTNRLFGLWSGCMCRVIRSKTWKHLVELDANSYIAEISMT